MLFVFSSKIIWEFCCDFFLILGQVYWVKSVISGITALGLETPAARDLSHFI